MSRSPKIQRIRQRLSASMAVSLRVDGRGRIVGGRARRILNTTKAFALAVYCAVLGVQAKPPAPPTPEAILAKLKAAPGVKVELVAAEPLIASPVAFAFDENRVLYVVEAAAIRTRSMAAQRV